jgi:hypothetical protein
MKKKQIKKKEPQVIEIHIYVHQNTAGNVTPFPPNGIYPPQGGAGSGTPSYPYTFIC